MELKILVNTIKNIILLLEILGDSQKRDNLISQIKGLIYLIDAEEKVKE